MNASATRWHAIQHGLKPYWRKGCLSSPTDSQASACLQIWLPPCPVLRGCLAHVKGQVSFDVLSVHWTPQFRMITSLASDGLTTITSSRVTVALSKRLPQSTNQWLPCTQPVPHGSGKAHIDDSFLSLSLSLFLDTAAWQMCNSHVDDGHEKDPSPRPVNKHRSVEPRAQSTEPKHRVALITLLPPVAFRSTTSTTFIPSTNFYSQVSLLRRP